MDFKKILPIAIIGVAVIALVVFAATKPAPAPTGASTQAPTGNQGGQAGEQIDTAPPSTEPVSSKDPATLVPDGMDLKAFCEKYYEAWLAKDWKTAFDMLPVSKKEGGNPESLSQQLEAYGLVGYSVGDPQENGNAATVQVRLDLGQNGTWATNWTFIKNDKGQWTVNNSVTGMSQ